MNAETSSLHVAVGVIERNGKILLSRRAPDVHQGGKWEFPGGKVEPGETVSDALARELQEELGITPTQTTPLIQIPFSYPERRVFLDVWKVTGFRGEPAGLEGQNIAWTDLDHLGDFDFPSANRPIIEALHLPSCIAITPEGSVWSDEFIIKLESLVAAGHLIHLRLPGLEASDYSRFVSKLAGSLPRMMKQIVLTSTVDEVASSGAAGLHLNARRLMEMEACEVPVTRLSASCHNLEELQKAESLGLRYVFLSPVLPTRTHPDAEASGWERFGALVRQVGIPVYALGGVAPELRDHARQFGAQGVAGIRGFWL